VAVDREWLEEQYRNLWRCLCAVEKELLRLPLPEDPDAPLRLPMFLVGEAEGPAAVGYRAEAPRALVLVVPELPYRFGPRMFLKGQLRVWEEARDRWRDLLGLALRWGQETGRLPGIPRFGEALVHFHLATPGTAIWDLDNYLWKAVLDALQWHGVLEDDRWVSLHVTKERSALGEASCSILVMERAGPAEAVDGWLARERLAVLSSSGNAEGVPGG